MRECHPGKSLTHSGIEMDTETLEFIKKEIEKIEAKGFGEVVVKVKNGYIFRLLVTEDTLFEGKILKKIDK